MGGGVFMKTNSKYSFRLKLTPHQLKTIRRKWKRANVGFGAVLCQPIVCMAEKVPYPVGTLSCGVVDATCYDEISTALLHQKNRYNGEK